MHEHFIKRTKHKSKKQKTILMCHRKCDYTLFPCIKAHVLYKEIFNFFGTLYNKKAHAPNIGI